MNEDDWFNKPWFTLAMIGLVFIMYTIYMFVGPKTVTVEKVIREPQPIIIMMEEQVKVAKPFNPGKQVITKIKIVEYHWFEFTATGYSANDEVQGTGDLNAMGKPARYGTIAVDPDVIPLGTWIEIKDMGWFVAQDTGGAVKGNKIDICFDNKEQAIQFGTKKVWIRYLGVIEDEI